MRGWIPRWSYRGRPLHSSGVPHGGRGRFAGALLVAIAAVCVAAPVAAQQPVLDPVLQRLLDPQVRALAADLRAQPAAPADEQPFGGTIAFDTDASGRARVGVLLELREPDVLAALRALGVEIGSVLDVLATARVPLDVLDRVVELPLVRIQAARMLRLVHDSSMSAIRADMVRQREDSGWTGTTGAGVIFGLIDTGLDILHPDFHDEAGGTRVLALWDQTFGAMPPAGFFYGFLCTRTAIQLVVSGAGAANEACPTQDFAGHGTHVSGTAVGDGSASSPAFRYAGVAPEAELLVVKAGNTTFPEDRVIDGMVWIRDEARARGRPAVLNLSLGHLFGPHDGTTFLERFIDGLAGPGFIVVLAAGNDGDNRTALPPPTTPRRLLHARVQPAAGQPATVEFQVTPYSPNINRCTGVFIELSVWYDVRDRVEITVMRPNGTSVVAAAGTTAQGNDAQGRIEIRNAAPLQAYPTTAEGYIQINGCTPSGLPAAGRWQVRMRPQPAAAASGTPIDLYIMAAVLGPGGSAFGTVGFDNRLLVGSPGGARHGITVGAFVSRTCWPAGTAPSVCYTAAPPVGEMAPFSSPGPTRDGRTKPEITAPGMAVMSALSRHTNPAPARITPNGMHWVLEGTSMAAPHVAGTILLMLQHRPTLAPEDVRDILARSARQDAFTARVYDSGPAARPSDWGGFGKLDAAAALNVLLGGGVVAAIDLQPAVDTIPIGGAGQLRVSAVDVTGAPVFAAYTWESLDPAVATVDVTGRVSGRQLGSARVVVRTGVLADTARIVVAPPAVLTVAGESLAPPEPLTAPAGTLLPLLQLRLQAIGPEGVDVRALGFEVAGQDTAARLVLLDDPAGTGQVDATFREVAGIAVQLAGPPLQVVLPTDTLFVPRNTTRSFIVAVELSGTAPTGATFSAALRPDATRTVTVNSRVANRVQHVDLIASEPAVTTVLRTGELFALSANPVRGESVNFSFAERPTAAAVYAITGSRVADLMPRFDGLAVRWDLTNDAGERIVPGVYILVFRIAGQLVRQRLIVLSPRVGT